jgi:hypothetical protein
VSKEGTLFKLSSGAGGTVVWDSRFAVLAAPGHLLLFRGAPAPGAAAKNSLALLGARVELVDSAGRQTRWVLAGDSFRSQSSGRVHFGLGAAQPVSAVVHWPGGGQTRLERPKVDTWHSVDPTP